MDKENVTTKSSGIQRFNIFSGLLGKRKNLSSSENTLPSKDDPEKRITQINEEMNMTPLSSLFCESLNLMGATTEYVTRTLYFDQTARAAAFENYLSGKWTTASDYWQVLQEKISKMTDQKKIYDFTAERIIQETGTYRESLSEFYAPIVAEFSKVVTSLKGSHSAGISYRTEVANYMFSVDQETDTFIVNVETSTETRKFSLELCEFLSGPEYLLRLEIKNFESMMQSYFLLVCWLEENEQGLKYIFDESISQKYANYKQVLSAINHRIASVLLGILISDTIAQEEPDVLDIIKDNYTTNAHFRFTTAYVPDPICSSILLPICEELLCASKEIDDALSSIQSQLPRILTLLGEESCPIDSPIRSRLPEHGENPPKADECDICFEQIVDVACIRVCGHFSCMKCAVKCEQMDINYTCSICRVADPEPVWVPIVRGEILEITWGSKINHLDAVISRSAVLNTLIINDSEDFSSLVKYYIESEKKLEPCLKTQGGPKKFMFNDRDYCCCTTVDKFLTRELIFNFPRVIFTSEIDSGKKAEILKKIASTTTGKIESLTLLHSSVIEMFSEQ